MSRSLRLACVLVLGGCPAGDDAGDTGAGSSSAAESTSATSTATSATNTTSSTGTSTATSTSSTAASGESGPTPACEMAVAEAEAFIMLNSACENDEDCTGFNGFCYPIATCGGVAVNAGADESEWNALHAVLEAECFCGADPCGACAVCDVGTCKLTVDCPGTTT